MLRLPRAMLRNHTLVPSASRAPMLRVGSPAGALHHDHVGAVIGHGHGEMRARQILRKVQNAQAGEFHIALISCRESRIVASLPDGIQRLETIA